MKNLYEIILIGGSIGEKRITSVKALKGSEVNPNAELFENRDDAKIKARRLGRSLSAGEKAYYGLRYTTAEVVDNAYTGK